MPTFDDSTIARAPVEEVWKLLYDPSRMVEWWAGVETIEPRGHEGRGNITVYPEGYPDFPMPQDLHTDGDGRRVTISCLVSDLRYSWRLEPVDGEDATRIAVHVEIPEQEAFRLDDQRAGVKASLAAIAALASESGGPGLEPLGVLEGEAELGPGRDQ